MAKQYTFDEILESATDIGDGWKKTVVDLEEGDSAPNPGSTKWAIAGPNQVIYWIHASGTDATTIKPVRRTYL